MEIIAAVVGSVILVLGVYFLTSRQHRRNAKLDIALDLVKYRNELMDDPRIYQALNAAQFVFSDTPSVMKALDAYWNNTRDNFALFRVAELICTHSGMCKWKQVIDTPYNQIFKPKEQ